VVLLGLSHLLASPVTLLFSVTNRSIARTELLKEEKEFTRLRDKINAQRRRNVALNAKCVGYQEAVRIRPTLFFPPN
jgi:hypothetical protein